MARESLGNSTPGPVTGFRLTILEGDVREIPAFICAHFRLTLGFKMRCGVSYSLALVRAFSGVLGWVNNRKLARVVSPEFREKRIAHLQAWTTEEPVIG